MSKSNEYIEKLEKIKKDFGVEPVNEAWFPYPSVAFCMERYGKIYQQTIGIVICKRLIDGTEKSFIGLAKGQNKLDDIYHIIEAGVPFNGKI